MTSAHEHIRRAEQSMRAVADQWNAADLPAIGNCVSVLESSVASLTAASQILKGLPESQGNELRATLAGLKKDANRLQRLVDASAAFLRGLPGAGCVEVELYEPGGSSRPIMTASDTWGLQG